MKVMNKPIEVLAFNKADGTILPFRFRVQMDDGELFSYDLKIIHVDNSQEYGKKLTKYTCQIEMNNTIKMCEIRYDRTEMTWTLFKI